MILLHPLLTSECLDFGRRSSLKLLDNRYINYILLHEHHDFFLAIDKEASKPSHGVQVRVLAH
jgi:hypothetical protein